MRTLVSLTASRLESRPPSAAKLDGSFLKQERSSFGNDTRREEAVKSSGPSKFQRQIVIAIFFILAVSGTWSPPARAMFLIEGIGEAGVAELATGGEGVAAAEGAAAVGAAGESGAAESVGGAADVARLAPRAARIAPSESVYEARTMVSPEGQRYFVQTPAGAYWVDRPGRYSVDLRYNPPRIRYVGDFEPTPAQSNAGFVPVPAPQNSRQCWMFQGNVIDNDTGAPYYGVACLWSDGRLYKQQ